LSEALWAHRISRHGATKVTHFDLIYGQEVVLLVEVNLDVYRLAKQNDLSVVVYHNLMMDNIDELTDVRLKTLKEIEKDSSSCQGNNNNNNNIAICPKQVGVG
jgi:hypothetical protein